MRKNIISVPVADTVQRSTSRQHHACIAGHCGVHPSRTQHNIVGLAPGSLGIPHRWLPPSCCLLPVAADEASCSGSADDGQAVAPRSEPESALFVTRDGGVGIIHVSWHS